MGLRAPLAAMVRSVRREGGASMVGSMAVTVVKWDVDARLGLVDLV